MPDGSRATGTDDITVAVTRLDDEIGPDAEVSFIKVDAEGADLLVLFGGSEIIARDRPTLLIEIAPGLLRQNNQTGADVGRFLREHGYTTYRYDKSRRRLIPVDASDAVGDLLAVHPRRAERLSGPQPASASRFARAWPWTGPGRCAS